MRNVSSLARLFNVLMGITPGYFGSSPKSSEPGSGTLRRQAREKAYRIAQAERLKDAAPAEATRQQLRRRAMGRG